MSVQEVLKVHHEKVDASGETTITKVTPYICLIGGDDRSSGKLFLKADKITDENGVALETNAVPDWALKAIRALTPKALEEARSTEFVQTLNNKRK